MFQSLLNLLMGTVLLLLGLALINGSQVRGTGGADQITTTSSTPNQLQTPPMPPVLDNETLSHPLPVTTPVPQTPLGSSSATTATEHGESTTSPNPWGNRALPSPVARQRFCALVEPFDKELGHSIYISCYCDDVCHALGDCCLASNLQCNERDISANTNTSPSSSPPIIVGADDLECRSQITKKRRGRLVSSRFFWMIKACPGNWFDDEIRENCENPNSTIEARLIVPVSDPVSGFTFRNSFCAMCHGVNQYKSWTMTVECILSNYDAFAMKARSVTSILEAVHGLPDCHGKFYEPDGIPGRPCIDSISNSHGQGILFSGNPNECYRDSPYRGLCGNTSITAITHVMPHTTEAFYARNHFCWLCRYTHTPSFGYCPGNSESDVKKFNPVAFSALVDPTTPEPLESCNSNTSIMTCPSEKMPEVCASPFLSLVNVLYKLVIDFMVTGNDTIAEVFDACKSFRFPQNLVNLLGNDNSKTWRPQRMGQKPYSCLVKNISSSTVYPRDREESQFVVQLSLNLLLAKYIRNYDEGFSLFASLQDRIESETVAYTYKGNAFPLRVIRDKAHNCASIQPPDATTWFVTKAANVNSASFFEKVDIIFVIMTGMAVGLIAFNII
ncbi:uncharacterized protein LOC106160040 [Lingula anatina]|uniref:Uncharacterized protein LOC106160040 n=1 Tax=Lingula anatina TaxID=7574 RepID=A0A1S3I2D9_LINAN|nr:uncharacterized protein LOC106160040 [Lingula anatina]|eukprot:XP_013391996.1 uncharacterized protein LOC106160040 [Lingula anatina]